MSDEPRRAALRERLDEVELIISGAVVFALVQLPSRVDEAYLALEPRLAGTLDVVAFLGFYYVKLILYTVIFTLVVHLGVRAFWVALEGLDSVFPGGIRWDELKQGPIARRVFPEAIPSVRTLADRADRLASILFSAAFSLVLIFAGSILVAVGVGLVSLIAVPLLPGDPDPGDVLLWGLMALVALFVLPTLLDRAVGDRLEPGGFAARALEASLRVLARGMATSFYGPIQFTLASRLGSRRAGFVIGGSVLALIAFFMVKDVFVPLDRLVLEASPALPLEAGALGVEPRYYEAHRNRWQLRYPSIESEIVSEDRPWVRLFVPFRPGVDDDALERVCPTVAATDRAPLTLRGPPRAPADSLTPAIARALACAASLWEVRLDGRPLTSIAGVAPVFLRHPETGVRGVARYLDVRDLSRGRHVLEVRRADAARDPDDPDPPPRHLIPFWR